MFSGLLSVHLVDLVLKVSELALEGINLLTHIVHEFVARFALTCKEEDIIIFSDLDEIPNPEKIKEILPVKEIFARLIREADAVK